MDVSRRGPARVEVTIDELVLDGVAPGDPRVARALELAVARARGADPANAGARKVAAGITAALIAAAPPTPTKGT